jgi:hypothetical protein
VLPHPLADVLDHAAHVAPGDVRLHDDLALHVLARDGVRPDIAPHVGQRGERDLAAGRRADARIADRLEAAAVRLRETYDEVEAPLLLQHLRHGLAGERDVDLLREVLRRDAVARHGRAVHRDADLRHFRLLLRGDVAVPGTPLTPPRPARRPAQRRAGRGRRCLSAMLARVPDSMWSMRWPIGWPIVICVPGTAVSAVRSSSSTSS